MDKRRRKDPLSQSTVKAMFDYDRDGHLRWKERFGARALPGEIAGTNDQRGHKILRMNADVDGRTVRQGFYIRDLVWIWHYGDLPPQGVMHSNLDYTDNRIENIVPNPVRDGDVNFL